MKWIVLICVIAFAVWIFRGTLPYLINMDRIEEFLYEKNQKDKETIDEIVSQLGLKGLKPFLSFVVFLVLCVVLVVIVSALRGAFTY